MNDVVTFLIFIAVLTAMFFSGGYVTYKIIKHLEDYERDNET